MIYLLIQAITWSLNKFLRDLTKMNLKTLSIKTRQ